VFGQVVTLIKHLHGYLTCDTMLTRDELALQSHHVYMLEEPIAQIVVNLEECPDHRMGKPFFNQLVSHHTLKIAR